MSNRHQSSWRRALTLAVLLSLFTGAVAVAQQTGNIYGTVTDDSGATLPGVTVTVEGQGAPKVTLTEADGQFRVLGLDPGAYYVKAELDGFSTVEQPNVVVALRRNTTINFTLSSAVEEVITVTSESPLLDERRMGAGTQVSQVELEKIPTARDPWSLLSQTPGVAVDRINVGGSESGQQSTFRAQGVADTENDFMVDGIQITDMGATGASPTYYDFDQFAEVSFTTGGTDVTKNTAGVEVNMVTKRGSNEFRGSARFFVTDADGYFNGALKQSNADFANELCDGSTPSQTCANEQTDLAGAQINRIEDIGFEAGGAVVQDRLWLWGSWGQNDVKTFASSGDADNTVLENTSIKLNAQLTSANSGIASYNNGDKVKNGRGAGPTRSPESLWDQRGPSAIYRFEDTHVFSSNLFATGTYSIVDLGFALLARGDVGTDGLDPAASDPEWIDGIWFYNFLSGASDRPGQEFKVDASYFFNTGSNTSHELKFGGRMREVEGTELFSWGPRNIFHASWGADVARHSQAGPTTSEYLSLWVQDTITIGNHTINAGLRFDDQTGTTDPVTIAPHQVFPEALPGFAVPGGENISTDSITPRLGWTYAMGEDRDTLLRASFSQFVAQLGSGQGNWTSPTYYGWYAYFDQSNGELYAAVYFDPQYPSVSPNTYGKSWDETTSEAILGVEHAFLPEFVAGFSVTWRDTQDIIDFVPNVRDGAGSVRTATLGDFEQVATQEGEIPRSSETYSLPVFDLGCGDFFDNSDGCATGGGTLGSGPRSREYLGYSINFTKRLANRWMARGFFSYGDAEWSVPGGYVGCINNDRGGGCNDGDLYVQRTTGSGKGERFLQATWSFNLNGMYQVAPDRPWGFNLSANIAGHEGHPIAYYDQITLSTGQLNQNILDDLDRYRLDDPITADFRIEKEFAVNGPVNLTFGLDVFNAFNENTGLAYNPQTDTSAAGWLQDNIVPRVYRLGVRLNWK